MMCFMIALPSKGDEYNGKTKLPTIISFYSWTHRYWFYNSELQSKRLLFFQNSKVHFDNKYIINVLSNIKGQVL